jgi:peptide methionine sulfoxide reductase MsrA
MPKPVVTEIFTTQPNDPTTAFWKAEQQHKRHYKKRNKKKEGISDEATYASTLSVGYESPVVEFC